MSDLERYSAIESGFRREFLLLQGKGCRWHRCTFCDYWLDRSDDPYETNSSVLGKVTGEFGVLDIINSGSAMEMDDRTLDEIARIVSDKGIEDLWFEAHWMYRDALSEFSKRFPCRVHYRIGVESFNPDLRLRWNKGRPRTVTPEMIRSHFDGVCLLVGLEGQSEEDIMQSVSIAESLFDYYSVNLFCPNSSPEKLDRALAERFIRALAPQIRKSRKAEVLIENTDLGVG